MTDRRLRAPELGPGRGLEPPRGGGRASGEPARFAGEGLSGKGFGRDKRSPLLETGWRYIETAELDDVTADDWALLNRQRRPFYAQEQGRQVLRLLETSKHDASFGYQINNYRHCLQAATLAHRAGEDEETVVAALLHDVGFVLCPDSHAAFAACLLASYVSERTHWMLRHHTIFQHVHLAGVHDPAFDPDERERWRGHHYFEWTAAFVDRYDQRAICPNYDSAPLDFFVPMVERVFARPPHRLVVD